MPNQPSSQGDFNLKPPANTPATPPADTVPAPATHAPTAASGTPGSVISAAGLPGETTSLSGTDAVIGVTILLVLAVAILFVRGALRSHLIAQRASPSAAGSAGWALFAFLLSLSVLVVFGLIGNLWSVYAFTVPLLVLVVVTLVLTILLYRAAASGHRAGRRRVPGPPVGRS